MSQFAEAVSAYKTQRVKYGLLPGTITAATSKNHVELEFKFPVKSHDQFVKIFSKITSGDSKPEIKCTLDVKREQKHPQSTLIRTQFVDPPKPQFEYSTKSKVFHKIYPDYKITIAVESTHDKWITQFTDDMRFKRRVSVVQGNWSLDLTMTHTGTVNSIQHIAKSIKQTMLENITLDNFTKLPQNIVPKFEFEAEWIGDDYPDENQLQMLVESITETSSEYENAFRKVAKQVKPSAKTFRRLGNQASAISKGEYHRTYLSFIDGWYVTIKLDGLRAFYYHDTQGTFILLSNKVVKVDPPKEPLAVTVLDGEYLDGKFYAFHVCAFNGESYLDAPFSQVEKLLNEACAACDGIVIAKKFYRIEAPHIDRAFKSVWVDTKYKLPTDGMILVEPNQPYLKTKNLKWKPADHQTIDFYVKKCPLTLINKYPYVKKDNLELYLLFVGYEREKQHAIGLGKLVGYEDIFGSAFSHYQPIQFSPSLAPFAYLFWHTDKNLDNKICELGPGKPDYRDWELIKVREDRTAGDGYYGNDLEIAESIYSNYIDPFDFEDLFTRGEQYFDVESDPAWIAGRRFRRFAVEQSFKYVKNTKWCVDLAAGHGQDLPRYYRAGISNLLCCDVDPQAIEELIKRKFEIAQNQQKQSRKHGGYDEISRKLDFDSVIVKKTSTLTVHTLVADLLKPADENFSRMFQFGIREHVVDCVICNFAIHYFCETPETLCNVLKLVSTLLTSGGKFIITCMNGVAVAEKLRYNTTYILNEDDRSGCVADNTDSVCTQSRVKHRITANFKSLEGKKNAPVGFGKSIYVKLPFSLEDKLEPLCDITALVFYAAKYGLTVVEQHSVDEYEELYKTAAPQYHAKLTDVDKEYASLHTVLVLELSNLKKGAGRR